MIVTYTTQVIEKESIPSLNFPHEPVDKSKDQIKILKKKLRRSMILGNIQL